MRIPAPTGWTWIGAAAFAARHGARLPTRAELTHLSRRCGTRPLNSDYSHGDVTPVVEPGRGARQIHHLLGNVQVWCGDGPDVGPYPGGRAVAVAARNGLEHAIHTGGDRPGP